MSGVPTRRKAARLAAGLLVAAWAGASPAHAASGGPASLEELMEQLASGAGVVANFHQEKHLALLAAPLHSRGRMIFVPPDCLVWRITEPAPSELVVDGARVTYRDGSGGPDGDADDGGRLAEIDLSGDPTAIAFVDNFVSLFRGDLPRLRERYELSFESERERELQREPGEADPESSGDEHGDGAGGWQLRLVPRERRVRGVVAAIELRGAGGPVEEMVLLEPDGDFTRTSFDSVDTSPAFAAEALVELFGPRSTCGRR